jgi:hypothetical protein
MQPFAVSEPSVMMSAAAAMAATAVAATAMATATVTAAAMEAAAVTAAMATMETATTAAAKAAAAPAAKANPAAPAEAFAQAIAAPIITRAVPAIVVPAIMTAAVEILDGLQNRQAVAAINTIAQRGRHGLNRNSRGCQKQCCRCYAEDDIAHGKSFHERRYPHLPILSANVRNRSKRDIHDAM